MKHGSEDHFGRHTGNTLLAALASVLCGEFDRKGLN